MGVLKYKSCTGMCCSNGSFFHKKSLETGPLFKGKTLNMGSFLQNFQNFGCLPSKILKNRPIFRGKSLEMGTFLAKMICSLRVLRLGRHILVQIKFKYPPPPLGSRLTRLVVCEVQIVFNLNTFLL